MKIAIIGLANSGKTTVFNALTRGTAETAAYTSGQLEPNLATVKVPDGRLAVLARMFNPKKVTPADVQYVDVAGLSSGGARQGGGLPPALLNYISGADALLHVARDRVIAESYKLLGLISFLTTGPDEVRAWTILQHTPAVEAAGAIHSDIQRGFIRAEIVAYDDLIKAGGMNEAKKAGTVRLEGKTYIVKDGDVCHFLFNV
jgi:ribosome-binding ATPase YchF (GTP1/OBG family)